MTTTHDARQGWTKVVTERHVCNVPRDYRGTGYGEKKHGSVWTCNGCGRQWYLLYDDTNHRHIWKTDHFPIALGAPSANNL